MRGIIAVLGIAALALTAGCGGRAARPGDGGPGADGWTASDGGAGCTSSAECGAGHYCFFAHGCGTTGKGTCKPRPGACPEHCPRICGCNGKTYCNSCEAAADGVSVASGSACASPDGCSRNADCESGQFCNLDQMCIVTGAKMGRCEQRPKGCDKAYRPACGCDGKTHSSTCQAHALGISVAYGGKCTTCGDLALQYAAELAKARQCSTLKNTPQCTLRVESNLFCGCQTHVDKDNSAALAALQDLAKKYHKQKCPVGDCGACPPLKHGECSGPGPGATCRDVPTP